MDTRTIALDSKNLEGGIEALSSAARAFQLTPFERGAYRALMVSVDVAAWSLVVLIAMIFILVLEKGLTPDQETLFVIAIFASVVAFPFAFVVGTVSLALNIPLIRKLYRERARLKELGLSSLSNSLWKESRRSRWISRARKALLILVGILVFLMAVDFGTGLIISVKPVGEPDAGVWDVRPGGVTKPFRPPGGEPDAGDDWKAAIFLALFFATIAVMIFSARYLRNQRERMELAASAEELKRALERLRQRAGKAEVVSVPSELLEQAARIESAQIAKERKDAVLQSVAVRPSGYAIKFDRDAADERATLGVADRVELEDLVAQLSTGGAQFESQPGAVTGAEGATLRGMTKSQRVEIEYLIDQTSWPRRCRSQSLYLSAIATRTRSGWRSSSSSCGRLKTRS
jgi:hypothetical protein